MSGLLSFEQILVTPYDGLRVSGGRGLLRGGPHWPEFDQQTLARHCIKGVPVDVPPLPTVAQETLDGRFAWGGPVYAHVGHQIAEFGMRLGPTLASWPEAVFLHAGLDSSAVASLDQTPPYTSRAKSISSRH